MRKLGFPFRRPLVCVAVRIDEQYAASVGCQRPVAPVGRNGSLVEPNLEANDNKLSLGGRLLRLWTRDTRRLNARNGIANVTIDLAKILPASRRQDFLTARQRDAAEQKHIARNNRQSKGAADAYVELGTARGSVK